MQHLEKLALALGLAVAAAPLASAHSLKDVEGQLGSREKFFQPVDKEAPDFALRDADGRTVRLADFRDRVVVLHFIYARCPDFCPLHADKIAEIQTMVNRTPMKDQVQFISITTDPERDTPEVLRDYGPAHGLDPANWMFLTSGPARPEDTTRRLAEQFGHKFTKTKDEYQVHGVVTHVIDREGRWRANFHGLRFEPTNLVVYVNALVNDVHRPQEYSGRNLWQRVKELFSP